MRMPIVILGEIPSGIALLGVATDRMGALDILEGETGGYIDVLKRFP